MPQNRNHGNYRFELNTMVHIICAIQILICAIKDGLKHDLFGVIRCRVISLCFRNRVESLNLAYGELLCFVLDIAIWFSKSSNHRHTQTDMQTDRQTDRQTHTHTHTHTHKHAHTCKHGQSLTPIDPSTCSCRVCSRRAEGAEYGSCRIARAWVHKDSTTANHFETYMLQHAAMRTHRIDIHTRLWRSRPWLTWTRLIGSSLA